MRMGTELGSVHQYGTCFDHWNVGTLEPWYIGTLVSWFIGTIIIDTLIHEIGTSDMIWKYILNLEHKFATLYSKISKTKRNS